MLYIDDGKLKADEVLVVQHSDVGDLVKGGWRILGLLGSTIPGQVGYTNPNWQVDTGMQNTNQVGSSDISIFIPLFIMGRDSDTAKLYQRVLNAEANMAQVKTCASETVNELEQLKVQIDELLERASTAALTATNAQKDAIEQRGKCLRLEEAVSKIRKEIGTGRMCEILGSLEVEQILDGKNTPAKDDDVLF